MNKDDLTNDENYNIINIPLLACPACNNKLMLDVESTRDYRILENDNTALAFRCENDECQFVKIMLKGKEQRGEN